MMRKWHIDADVIRQLSDLLTETGLSEIDYEMGGKRIRVRRDQAASSDVFVKGGQKEVLSSKTVSPSPPGGDSLSSQPVSSSSQGGQAGAITAPMVGTVYLASEPDSPPYVQVGDSVQEGQTLMIIEAMKTMNPVLADRSGTVSRILVTNGVPVEYGEVLMIIE